MGASQASQDQVRDLHRQYPGVVWTEPWYESDQSAFFWRGVPCVPFSSVGVANVNHLPADTIEWISQAKLAEAGSLVTEIVEGRQEKLPAWCRDRGSA